MPVINIQPREKLDHFSQDFLEVHSIFDTIQGEGPFAGRAAVFVRLAGCNLQCPGCDTDYTGNRAKMATPEIVMEVNSMVSQRRETNVTPPLVVITGGEPLRQNITLLCEMLVTAGCQVQLETNGVLPPPPGLLDICTAEEYLCFPANVPRILHRESGLFIVVSPKTHRINSQIASYASAYKYVVNEEQGTDGRPSRLNTERTARWPGRRNGGAAPCTCSRKTSKTRLATVEISTPQWRCAASTVTYFKYSSTKSSGWNNERSSGKYGVRSQRYERGV